jgi:ATP-dependent Clp protease ATP-binding subunit ClpC
VFERFTHGARRVVVFAQEEARLLNHNYIGTEHLLLGLIREDEGVAAKALQVFGVSLTNVRSHIEDSIGSGVAPSGHVPFTPRSKTVLALSLREARQLGHDYIGTEHILLGLVREGEGVAAQLLVTFAGDLDRVREQTVHMLAGSNAESTTASRELGDAPRCNRCGAGLASSAAYRVVEAQGAAPDDEVIRFVVVYCSACGFALGSAS